MYNTLCIRSRNVSKGGGGERQEVEANILVNSQVYSRYEHSKRMLEVALTVNFVFFLLSRTYVHVKYYNKHYKRVFGGLLRLERNKHRSTSTDKY